MAHASREHVVLKKRARTWMGAALLTSVTWAAGVQPPNGAAPASTIEPPSELTPMTIDAELNPPHAQAGATVMVSIGVRLLPGWHTYARVPPEEPYVQTKWILEPGAGLTASGDWIAPPAVPDAHNPQMQVYESQPEPLIFLHGLRVANDVSGELTVRTGLVYQTCNFSRCLPPTRKTFDLKLSVAPSTKRATSGGIE
jgi:Disulphide bond corrector protein DsbC